MNNKERRRGLGRGLSALMADVDIQPSTEDSRAATIVDQMVPVESVYPNPDQPRRQFDEESLNDLVSSIAEKGVIQPLIVRRHPTHTDAFEIVAGERRWRAAQRAHIHSIPVILRELDDTEVLEVAIIENIQRADLNPIEEAAGYQQLMDRFGHTQEQMSQALGKSRSHIANLLRLLKLPDEIKSNVEQGLLSMGHARALLTADDPITLAKEVVARGMSVRETEKKAKAASEAPSQRRGAAKLEKDADTRALEQDLSAQLGFPVSISHRPGDEGGKLTLSYRTFEQLDDLCRKLTAHD